MDAVKRRAPTKRSHVSVSESGGKRKRLARYDGRRVREDIFALHREGYEPRRIAGALGVSLRRVEAVLAAGRPPAGFKKKAKAPSDTTPKTEGLVEARHRKEIAELEYRRELKLARERGDSQRDIAKKLQISQPSVKSALDTAAKVRMPLPGFSGAGPGEICQRYAAGLIGREQLVDELARFPYRQGDRTDGYDTLLVDPSGTWSEVSNAVRRGLIPDDVYEEVFIRRHAS